VSILELKGEAPVSIYPNGPTAAIRSLQWMQPKSRNIHVINRLGSIQSGEQHPKPFGVCWLDSRGAPRLKELPETFVPERLNHMAMIACCASRNKAGL
jgi:hypothetical protein